MKRAAADSTATPAASSSVPGTKKAKPCSESKVDDGSAAARKPSSAFDLTRMRPLNAVKTAAPGPVLYWMSRDQRVNDNWALLYAQQQAVKNGCPLVVCFNLVPRFLEASIRQFGFMLRGLREVEASLAAKRIPFVLLSGDPLETLPRFVQEGAFSLLVCDFSPLRVGVHWRSEVAKRVKVPVHEVDAHNIVPVWIASDHIEYAARTIRPKIHGHLKHYLTEFPSVDAQTVEWSGSAAVKPIDWDAVIAGLEVDRTVPEVSWCKPGEDAARAALDAFTARLGKYGKERNDPSLTGERCSGLSPYFHFGQLAPARAALEVAKFQSRYSEGAAAFLEEAIVRRELSDNYCFYNPDGYDRINGLYPQFNNECWAQKTLQDHARDKRAYVYSQAQLETGQTHDELWNAAQLEMVHVGKMHGFMRMYWAKKILEWTPSPEEALRISIYLNDKYELDGRDPNGYVGCAWSIGGVHDNGWTERPVFGKIRYMNYEGCKRKFNIAAYVSKVKQAVKAIAKAK